MQQEVPFVILLIAETIVLYALAPEARLFFTIFFLVVHYAFDNLFPQYSSDYLSIWIFGIMSNLIIRQILPLYFWPGYGDLLSCRILWGGMIHLRLIVHYIQLMDILGRNKDTMVRYDSFHKIVFFLLVIDQILIFLPVILRNHPHGMALQTDVSILNLFGNSLYAFLIFNFTGNLYLSMSSYFICWIDGMDIVRCTVITLALLLIRYDQSSKSILPIDSRSDINMDFGLSNVIIQKHLGTNEKDKNK